MLTAIDTTLDEQLASYISYLTTHGTKQEDFHLLRAENSLVNVTTNHPGRLHTNKMNNKTNAEKKKCKLDPKEQMNITEHLTTLTSIIATNQMRCLFF